VADLVLTHFDPFQLTIPNATREDGTVIANLSSVIDGDINADTITLTGDAEIGWTLEVTGASTLAAVTATTVGTTGAVTAGNGLTVTTGVADLSAATTLKIPAASAPNQYSLQVWIKDIISANAAVGYVVVPLGGAGTITQVAVVADNLTATGSVIFTSAIGATPVTNGAVTLASGVAAGTAATPAVPTAAKTVAAGNVVKVTVSGTQTAAGTAMVTLSIRLTVPA